MSLYLAIPISLLITFAAIFLGNFAVLRGDTGAALGNTFALFGGAILMIPLIVGALVCLAALFFLAAA